jgi:hypothetical protein
VFRNNPKLMAAGAFLAGGVLVGGITFGTAVAHGAGTGGAGKGLSDAQYTSEHAWVQPIGGPGNVALSIPSGEQLTITGTAAYTGQTTCTLDATLNGLTAAYTFTGEPDGTEGATFQTPIYAQSGNKESCSNANIINLVGYLTPIPAG